jgi:hypothetical protein
LDQAVGERGLSMVDMGDDGEVADQVQRRVGHAQHVSAKRWEGEWGRESGKRGSASFLKKRSKKLFI